MAPGGHGELAVRVTSSGEESALLVRCPEAESAVGAWRDRLDMAASMGVPAHATVTYPFRPVQALTTHDHARLEQLFGALPSFTLVGERTAWFGEEVLYVALTGSAHVSALIDAVAGAFPEHPPYGGSIADVVPHVTVGHDQDVAVLRAAEEAVRAALPFTQVVTQVELWTGPPPRSGRGGWRRVRAYPLG